MFKVQSSKFEVSDFSPNAIKMAGNQPPPAPPYQGGGPLKNPPPGSGGVRGGQVSGLKLRTLNLEH
jgi:hypothetical protein